MEHSTRAKIVASAFDISASASVVCETRDDLTGCFEAGPIESKFEWGHLGRGIATLGVAVGLAANELPKGPWNHQQERHNQPHAELAQSLPDSSQFYGRPAAATESTASAIAPHPTPTPYWWHRGSRRA
jgi:hypothetical protein